MPEGCSFPLSWLTAMCLWERRLSEGSKWETDQLLHWSSDWLGWKAEKVRNNEWVSECMHMRGINTHETTSTHLSPHSAGWWARLRFRHVINCSQPQTHLNFNELNRQWFASKAISPNPAQSPPSIYALRVIHILRGNTGKCKTELQRASINEHRGLSFHPEKIYPSVHRERFQRLAWPCCGHRSRGVGGAHKWALSPHQCIRWAGRLPQRALTALELPKRGMITETVGCVFIKTSLYVWLMLSLTALSGFREQKPWPFDPFDPLAPLYSCWTW